MASFVRSRVKARKREENKLLTKSVVYLCLSKKEEGEKIYKENT